MSELESEREAVQKAYDTLGYESQRRVEQMLGLAAKDKWTVTVRIIKFLRAEEITPEDILSFVEDFGRFSYDCNIVLARRKSKNGTICVYSGNTGEQIARFTGDRKSILRRVNLIRRAARLDPNT